MMINMKLYQEQLTLIGNEVHQETNSKYLRLLNRKASLLPVLHSLERQEQESLCLPPSCRYVSWAGNKGIAVFELPPAIRKIEYSWMWGAGINKEYAREHGLPTLEKEYRPHSEYLLSYPYIYVVCFFKRGYEGGDDITFDPHFQPYFSHQPIRSLDSPLGLPYLDNMNTVPSKGNRNNIEFPFTNTQGCYAFREMLNTNYHIWARGGFKSYEGSIRVVASIVEQTLFSSAFNEDMRSTFTCSVNPEQNYRTIASKEEWAKKTETNPGFILEKPFAPLTTIANLATCYLCYGQPYFSDTFIGDKVNTTEDPRTVFDRAVKFMYQSFHQKGVVW